MNAFEDIFGSDTIDNMEFDTIFGSEEDGELIDSIGQNELFTESGDPKEEDDNTESDADSEDGMEEATYEDLADLNTLYEAANFSFLPRFKQIPELRQFQNLAAEADDILNSEGIASGTTIHKIGNLIFRFFDIMQNAGSILYIPSCLFIIGIPYYLLTRLWEYCFKLGEYAVAESYAKKVMMKLKQLENHTKDPKVKKKCQEQIDKIQKSLSRIRRSKGDGFDEYDESTISAGEFESMMEADDFNIEEGCGSKRKGKCESCKKLKEGTCKKEACRSAKDEGCGSKEYNTEEFDSVIAGDDDMEEGCKSAKDEACGSKKSNCEGCKVKEGCKKYEGCSEEDDEECDDYECDEYESDDDDECRGGECDDEDDDFDGFDGENDDFEDLQAFNEKPCKESEIDSPETTIDLDRIMDEPGNARPQDLRDSQNNEEDNSFEVKDEFYAAESTAEFENQFNFDGDEDLSPDSEGALDDGEDIDSINS